MANKKYVESYGGIQTIVHPPCKKNPYKSEAEKKALYEKLENPEKTVICPRCGNEIIYEVRGNSVAVECTRPNCIYGGLRGL